MNFSKISRVMVLSSLMGLLLCGVDRAADMSSAPGVVASIKDLKANESSTLPVEDSNVKDMSPAPETVARTEGSKVNDGSVIPVEDSNPGVSKDDKNCKALGSFTVNSTLLKQSSHFGLFKDENGIVSVKDITDENKNDTNKLEEYKSYKVTYDCYMCYYPDCKTEDSNSESVDESTIDEKVESEAESTVESVTEESQSSEQ